MKLLSRLWVGPLTLVGLLYCELFVKLGWYERIFYPSIPDVRFYSLLDPPSWLTDAWSKWKGQTIGEVVVLRDEFSPKSSIVRHELAHVEQCRTLGILMPLAYVLSSLCAMLAGLDGYKDNHFELAARAQNRKHVEEKAK